jgi:thioredoxin reductase
MPENSYDAIIVGGGPAGLSAALVLGRCRRSVLLCDAGNQRNKASDAMHGYLTRDGISPAEFLKTAVAEVKRYGVEVRLITVKTARAIKSGFRVVLDDKCVVRCRKLLIATGMCDQVPELGNMDRFYGKSVHHCPYCDGWEHRDKRIAVYSKKPGLSFAMKNWTLDVALFTDGPVRLSRLDRQRLETLQIPVYKQPIDRIDGTRGRMERIVFKNGDSVERDAMFFSTGQHQTCDLAANLGCELNKKGTIDTNRFEMTNVPGLFVAGDATRDVQMVIVAAAEGAKAAFAINSSFQKEELAQATS